MTVKRIGLIGECMIELNGAPFGEMVQRYGGDALNSAVYLARAAGDAVEVNFISAMGTDPLSKGMISRWQAEGVNTAHVLIDPHHQRGYTLSNWMSRASARFFTGAMIPQRVILSAIRNTRRCWHRWRRWMPSTSAGSASPFCRRKTGCNCWMT